eukprot:TRINITY_DN8098_c0_g1_i3.p1 TRINITY_DN8098_c0_g1~~TRINITY_DN8098_c0_g1_i3.p1  ORF type:complete len:365 (+),score=115.16 TRINITY_DN8098_c0_g1_i3:64-1095(+)
MNPNQNAIPLGPPGGFTINTNANANVNQPQPQLQTTQTMTTAIPLAPPPGGFTINSNTTTTTTTTTTTPQYTPSSSFTSSSSSSSSSSTTSTTSSLDASTAKKELRELDLQAKQMEKEAKIAHLLRPGAKYFNLNPFHVLQVPLDATDSQIKKSYRKLSLLVHPDKNRGLENAQEAFEAVNRAHKILMDEEQRKFCEAVVQTAKTTIREQIEKKRIETTAGDGVLPEDDPETQRKMIEVETCKLFAEVEMKKKKAIDEEAERNKKKREREIEVEEKYQARIKADKDWEQNRETRVDSWRQFAQGGKKKSGPKKKKRKTMGFKPPKPKIQERKVQSNVDRSRKF